MVSSDQARGAANAWRGVVLLVLCLLVAGISRWRETSHPLSFDEIFLLAGSVGQGMRTSEWTKRPNQLQDSAAPLTSVQDAPPLGTLWTNPVPYHPPLYIISLRLWREWWGGSDQVASAFSAFCSTLAIGLVFLALRQQVGDGLATLTCLILGLSPMQIHLGTEVRGYALAFLWTAIAVWLMVWIEKRGPTRATVWLLGLVTLPLMLTHYFALGSCLAIALWGWWRLPRRDQLHLLGGLVLAGIVFVLAWGPFFRANVSDSGADFLKSNDPFWRRSLIYATDLPMRLLVYSRIRPLSACASLAMLGLVGLQLKRRDTEVLPWALLLLLPLLLLLGMDGASSTKHTSFTRYYAIALIGMPAAAIVAAFRWRPAVAWGLGLVLLAWVVADSRTPRDIGSLYAYPAQQAFLPAIQSGPADRPMVIYCSPREARMLMGLSLYFELQHAGLHSHPTMMALDPSQEAMSALRSGCRDDRFWLLVPGELRKDRQLPEDLRARLQDAEVDGEAVSVPRGSGYISPRPPAVLWLMRFKTPTTS